MFKIGIIGLGVVGNAIYETLSLKDVILKGYDKFKNGGIGTFQDCLNMDILFLCLPTPYSNSLKDYQIDSMYETLDKLNMVNYTGSVVIKSTVNIGTCEEFSNKYNLNIIHNPEFLTARNAKDDFNNQEQIVIGRTSKCSNEAFERLINFYKKFWKNSIVSICNSGESELMKLSCNSFYAVKIQFMTELYLIAKKNNMDFNLVKNMMILNQGISPNYTQVPGHDGQISYGGMCFPKDTNALCSYMRKNNLPNNVLQSVITERNLMRNENQIGISE